MHENISEQITVDDMARTAMFSKFHFSRVFQRATGVSPGRFLSAIRLQEAKRLLVATTLSVTEISHRVGYSSVGTFSSRFSSTVGLSPTTFRRRDGLAARICPPDRLLVNRRRATIRGRVWAPPAGRSGRIFIGLFPDRLPQGRPVRCTSVDRPGPYALGDVPQGTWHLLMYSAEDRHTEHDELIPAQRDGGVRAGTLIGSNGPIVIRPEILLRPADVHLRQMNAFDPPVLLALLRAQSAN